MAETFRRVIFSNVSAIVSATGVQLLEECGDLVQLAVLGL